MRESRSVAPLTESGQSRAQQACVHHAPQNLPLGSAALHDSHARSLTICQYRGSCMGSCRCILARRLDDRDLVDAAVLSYCLLLSLYQEVSSPGISCQLSRPQECPMRF